MLKRSFRFALIASSLLWAAAALVTFTIAPPPLTALAQEAQAPGVTQVAEPVRAPVVVNAGGALSEVDPGTGKVVIPYGQYLSQILVWAAAAAGTLAAAAIAYGAKLFGDKWKWIGNIGMVEQLLKRAIEYAANVTAGATKDKKIEVNVANDFLRNAIQYAIDSAPGWLITFMGGEPGLRAKLIARADFADGVHAGILNAPPPSKEAKDAVAAGQAKPIGA